MLILQVAFTETRLLSVPTTVVTLTKIAEYLPKEYSVRMPSERVPSSANYKKLN